MLKLIQIQRNVVSDIANIVIVSIMESSNFLHDVWFDIFFLIESKLSNLCILKILQISKHHDMSVHRLFSTQSRVLYKGHYTRLYLIPLKSILKTSKDNGIKNNSLI